MYATSKAIGKKILNKGFTLVELIVVIAIMAILGLIAAPSFVGYTKKVKEQVCNTNSTQLERMYHSYLVLEGIDHTGVVFNQYLQQYDEDICPDNGVISYEQDTVKCKVHSSIDENEDNDDGIVPYL